MKRLRGLQALAGKTNRSQKTQKPTSIPISQRDTHLAHEVVGEVRRQHLGHELRPKVVGVGSHGGHHSGGDPEAVVHGADRVEEWLLVLLEVLVVRARETLQTRQTDKATRGGRHAEGV